MNDDRQKAANCEMSSAASVFLARGWAQEKEAAVAAIKGVARKWRARQLT